MQRDKDTQDPWSTETTAVTKFRLRQQNPPSRFDPYQGVMAAKRPAAKGICAKLASGSRQSDELSKSSEKPKTDGRRHFGELQAPLLALVVKSNTQSRLKDITSLGAGPEAEPA